MSQAGGRFITVEGQDGAGKTTNLGVIREALELRGIEVVETREPGGTQLGEVLRELVLNRHDLNIVPMAELLVIFAARAQHLHDVIQPALSAGKWVLCDRFTDASYAYQGGGRGIPLSTIGTVEQLVQGRLRPDLTLLFDVDIETGCSRAQRRSVGDRFEAEDWQFKAAVRRQYLALVKQHPERIKLIDASRPLDTVKRQVTAVIDSFLHSIHG